MFWTLVIYIFGTKVEDDESNIQASVNFLVCIYHIVVVLAQFGQLILFSQAIGRLNALPILLLTTLVCLNLSQSRSKQDMAEWIFLWAV